MHKQVAHLLTDLTMVGKRKLSLARISQLIGIESDKVYKCVKLQPTPVHKTNAVKLREQHLARIESGGRKKKKEPVLSADSDHRDACCNIFNAPKLNSFGDFEAP